MQRRAAHAKPVFMNGFPLATRPQDKADTIQDRTVIRTWASSLRNTVEFFRFSLESPSTLSPLPSSLSCPLHRFCVFMTFTAPCANKFSEQKVGILLLF
jgi:hypothetical protein